MGRKKLLLGITIVVLSILLFWRPDIGWNLRRVLVGSPENGTNGADELRAENVRLKRENALLESLKFLLPEDGARAIPAFVYVQDPLNFKDELLVSAGRSEGIVLGLPVLVSGLLAGEIAEVYETASLVKTIFDSRWKSSVRIGKEGIEALFEGGNLPTLTLISKEAFVAENDVVYSAAPDLPYGLPIGTAKNVRKSRDELFQEADVAVPYVLRDITTVLIRKPQ